jgi:nicotinamidase-related amidase
MAKRVNLPIDVSAERCGQIFLPDYQALMLQAEQYARDNGITPAHTDKFKVAVYDIDQQCDFCIAEDPRIGYKGALYVIGAEKSTSRGAEQFLRNLRFITTYRKSRDTHWRAQIFFPYHIVALRDFTDPIFNVQYHKGDHPVPYTEIDADEVEFGRGAPTGWKWGVNPAMSGAIQVKVAGQDDYTPLDIRALQRHFAHYNQELKSGNRYKLCVWPYHCMAEGIGSTLVPVTAEVDAFWGFARGGRQLVDHKGGHYLSENYSVFRQEVMTTVGGHQIAQRNTIALDMLRAHDAVLYRGQAGSHCVPWSIDDMLTDILANDPALAKKVWIVTDCMDPVEIPGVKSFRPEQDAAIARFKDANMNVITSDVPFPDFLPVK